MQRVWTIVRTKDSDDASCAPCQSGAAGLTPYRQYLLPVSAYHYWPTPQLEGAPPRPISKRKIACTTCTSSAQQRQPSSRVSRSCLRTLNCIRTRRRRLRGTALLSGAAGVPSRHSDAGGAGADKYVHSGHGNGDAHEAAALGREAGARPASRVQNPARSPGRAPSLVHLVVCSPLFACVE